MRILLSLFVGLIVLSLITSGCTKSNPTTVYDTLRIHDTLTKNDTIPDGVSFIRCVALLKSGGSIQLLRDTTNSSTAFASADAQSGEHFWPIRSDTSELLFAKYYDIGVTPPIYFPFTIPVTFPQALVTIVFFESQTGSGLFLQYAQDTAIAIPAPTGYGYMRFINGLSDYPQPPAENLFLDSTTGPPIFTTPGNHLRQDVTYGTIANYVLVPIGTHTIIAAEASGFQPYTNAVEIRQGGYYTCRLIGSHTDGHVQLDIDIE